MSVAEEIYERAKDDGIDALLDDREERPGVKFKDADLIGIPYRVTVGRKVTSGLVELVERSTKQTTDVKISEVSNFLRGAQLARDAAVRAGSEKRQPMGKQQE